jgi:hypothetical protein
MITGVAFGMILLSSAAAIVALFTLPTGWAALASLPVFRRRGALARHQPRARPADPRAPKRHPMGPGGHVAGRLDAASAADRYLADHHAGGSLVKTLIQTADIELHEALTRPGSLPPRSPPVPGFDRASLVA